MRELRECDGALANPAAPFDLCGAIHENDGKGKGIEPEGWPQSVEGMNVSIPAARSLKWLIGRIEFGIAT
jgi:hypothetical protein